MQTMSSRKSGFTQISARESRGFTLIELLVVIAIIGILASIVLASLGSARAKGRDAKRISDIKQLQVALELYQQDHNGKYPAHPSFLIPPNTQYIAQEPKDPSSGASYKYAAPGVGVGVNCSATTYHLGALLENGNAALATDADAPIGTSPPSPCTTGARFEGNSSDCGGSVSSPDLCYDVTQ